MAVSSALLLQHLHRLSSDPDEVSDAALLDRFLRGGDESAFATLVCRHGPMVLGLCRRLLGNGHDADDAFQDTFLTLARSAPAVRHPEALACWLHGVALRLARKARTAAERRRRREARAARGEPDPAHDPLAEM